jgi:Ca2+-binding EF-hand superfamily protein
MVLPILIERFGNVTAGTHSLSHRRNDRDHDGTLDKRELRGRVSAKDFAAADPDKDGTLDRNEFLALVEKRFKAADPDNDGTIDRKELKRSAVGCSC